MLLGNLLQNLEEMRATSGCQATCWMSAFFLIKKGDKNELIFMIFYLIGSLAFTYIFIEILFILLLFVKDVLIFICNNMCASVNP